MPFRQIEASIMCEKRVGLRLQRVGGRKYIYTGGIVYAKNEAAGVFPHAEES